MSTAETKKKKSEEKYVWVYGQAKGKKRYEFHPDLQEHIEMCYQNERKTCKLYIFGTVFTLDFEKMIKIKEKTRTSTAPIKRIKRSQLKKLNVVGISGAPYEKAKGYKQTDGICHVCLYKPTLKTRLRNCGHEFCYMCLKNNFTMGMECPTCRAEISSKTFDFPIRNDMNIHEECPDEYINDCMAMFKMSENKGKKPRKNREYVEPVRRSTRATRTKYCWIYESRSPGWYRYDPKSEKYLEECYLRKKKQCYLFISGYKMTISIKKLLQERNYGGLRRSRKIKRVRATELHKHAVKGIAGIRGFVKILE